MGHYPENVQVSVRIRVASEGGRLHSKMSKRLFPHWRKQVCHDFLKTTLIAVTQFHKTQHPSQKLIAKYVFFYFVRVIVSHCLYSCDFSDVVDKWEKELLKVIRTLGNKVRVTDDSLQKVNKH